MESKPHIFVVDDSPEEIHILLTELKSSFRVSATTSGEAALRKLEDSEGSEYPDIVLLDVNMTGMDGYQTCREIRSHSKWDAIDIIFLSANDSTDEIMRGFEAGATDYLVKPYDPEVLKSKLTSVLAHKKMRSDALNEASQAKEFASSVLSESGNLANIVTFLRKSFEVKSASELLTVTLETLSEFSLSSAIYFDESPIKLSDSTSGLPSMIELELLERFLTQDKAFIERNDKVFFIQKNIVVLVRNMPIEPGNRASLKDNIKILLDGVGAKLATLAEMEKIKEHKLNNAYQLIERAKQTLNNIQSQQRQHKEDSVSILDAMVKDIENAFYSMGLTDDQEFQILQIMNRAVETSFDHFENGLKLDLTLRDLVNDLAKTVQA